MISATFLFGCEDIGGVLGEEGRS